MATTAAQIATEHHVDIAVLDAWHPRTRSCDAVLRMRCNFGAREAVFVSTVCFERDDLLRYLATAGFDYVATKPIDPREVEELMVHPTLTRRLEYKRHGDG